MANTKPLTKKEQQERNAFTMQKCLFFLQKETFSDLENMTLLLEYASKWGAKKGLERLEKKGLIKHKKMETLTGQFIDLYGITAQGIYAVSEPEELPERIRGFEPSRVSLLTLPHRLKTHNILIHLIQCNFEHLQINSIFKGAKKLPDALIENPNTKQKSALEIELSIKAKPRYAKIIKDYQTFIDKDSIKNIHWITDDERKKKHLTNIFKELGAPDNHKIWLDKQFIGKIAGVSQ